MFRIQKEYTLKPKDVYGKQYYYDRMIHVSIAECLQLDSSFK